MREISVHEKDLNVEDISKMEKLINWPYPRVIKIKNMVDMNEFLSVFDDESLFYSYNGNSTILCGLTTIKTKTINQYIFSDIIETPMYKTMNKYFPRFEFDVKYVVSRIYCGESGTGSHFHYHPSALNYLISGKKLWVMLPPTLKNTNYYHKNMEYCSTGKTPIEWLDINLPHMLKNLDNVYMFTQDEKTCVFIPENWYHFVANLTDVVGITYSWKI